MTPVKLTTTAEVLQHMREVGGRNWRHATAETYAADTATATYLAECVRLRQCVDDMEHMLEDDGTKEGRDIADGWNACVNTLRAALDEVK